MFSDHELMLLTVLGERSATLAEIDADLAARGMRDWLVYTKASVLNGLKSLVRQDFVSVAPAREQSVFTITEAGRGALQTSLSELLRYPAGMNGFALALSGLRALRPAQVYSALKDRRAALHTQTDTLLSALAEHSRGEAEAAMLSYLLEATRAEDEWIGEFLKRWATQYPAVQARGEAPAEAISGEGAAKAPTAVQRRTKPMRNTKSLQVLKRPPADKR